MKKDIDRLTGDVIMQVEAPLACNMPGESMVTGEDIDEVRAVAMAFGITIEV